MKINVDLVDSSGNRFYYIRNFTDNLEQIAAVISNELHFDVDGYIFYNKDNTTILNKDYSYASFCGNAAKIINYMEDGLTYCSIANSIVKFEKYFNGITINIKKEAHVYDEFVYVNVFNDHILIKEEILDKSFLLEKSIELMSKYNMNIGYYNHDNEIINLLTYERGVGYTKSCGSNSIAVSVLMHKITNRKRFKIRTNGYNYEIFFNTDGTITLDGNVEKIESRILDIQEEQLHNFTYK